ncbi:hypothetical protein [Vibrio sp. 10N.261.55.A7]|uniref:hypothetical protein n=1 Tax=Vibrio sp. 10N.261.55.A7 TaxID=1880851 RepID=UPI000C8154DA|nr:hypothetical protein [Vibrio sp. 10N.261.55.A7]
MRPKWLLFTLSTALLISLPKEASSQHCIEAQWNIALKEQARIENWYNIQASRFNHLYSQYKQQVLLHKEFSLDELVSLWRPDATDFHLKLTQQIELSSLHGSMLEKEIKALQVGLPDVEKIRTKWNQFSEHCQSMSLNINALSSMHYVNSNRVLMNEIELLKAKLTELQRLYMKEAETLSKAQLIADGKLN